MSNHSTITMKKILDMYKGFEGLDCLVDVSGGIGSTSNMIVSKHPSIKAINYDLPYVIANAPEYLVRCRAIEHVGGDMFVSIPKGDAIFMKWILHDWSDELCAKALKNCSSDGKMIIVESIIPEFPETNFATKHGFHGDTIMLANWLLTLEEKRGLRRNLGICQLELDLLVLNLFVVLLTVGL